MTDEDEEFNRIEREAAMRLEAVSATVSSQRTWIGLTDAELDAYFEDQWAGYSNYYDCFKEIVRWHEAKLKEKNT